MTGHTSPYSWIADGEEPSDRVRSRYWSDCAMSREKIETLASTQARFQIASGMANRGPSFDSVEALS
jgi:hypothetical protein